MMEVLRDKVINKYETYKKANDSWIGDVPSHWEIVKLKRLLREKKKANDVSLPCGSISFGKVVFKDDEKIPESTKRSYQVVEEGEYLLNPLNLNYDLISLRIALSDKNVVVSSGYIVLQSFVKIDKTFFKWLLHRYDVAFMKTLGSGVRQTINFSDIGDSELVFPPLEEQAAIAQFIETKATLIDKAILIKEKQIELLKERQRVLIHSAVTHGLDPNVKMKNSGVDWIEKIPRHWEIKKLKYVVKILKRIIGYEGPNVLSITLNGIKVKDVSSGEGQLAMDYSKYQIVNKGEFAMNHMDLLTGYVDISAYDGVISPDYRVFKSDYKNVTDSFLLILFQVGYKSKIFYRHGQGVSQLGRWRFPSENFNNFFIPIPPKEEQEAISKFVEISNTKISSTISQKEKEI